MTKEDFKKQLKEKVSKARRIIKSFYNNPDIANNPTLLHEVTGIVEKDLRQEVNKLILAILDSAKDDLQRVYELIGISSIAASVLEEVLKEEGDLRKTDLSKGVEIDCGKISVAQAIFEFGKMEDKLKLHEAKEEVLKEEDDLRKTGLPKHVIDNSASANIKVVYKIV